MAELDLNQINELKARMQAIIFSIEDGIVMTDFAGNILVLNDTAKKMLGIQKGYPYERKFLDYIDHAEVRAKFQELFKSTEKDPVQEIVVPREHGPLYLKTRKSLVTTAKGEILGQMIALRDVTVEKNLENLKDDFLHSITHDLKSPLTSVQGFLGLFHDGELGTTTPEQRHYLEIMMHSTNKLLKMINNILDIAKFEAGKVSLSFGPWEAVSAVREIVDSFRGVAKHHKIRLLLNILSEPGDAVILSEMSMDDGRPGDPAKPVREVVVEADGLLLERVIVNLLDNAMKFTPMDGEIEVRVEDHADRLEVSVRDTGRGIPADSLDKLFHKFSQVPGTKGGTGLGLTIVKYVVEAHGGKIGVSSRPGKGTTFRFWVPKTTVQVLAARP